MWLIRKTCPFSSNMKLPLNVLNDWWWDKRLIRSLRGSVSEAIPAALQALYSRIHSQRLQTCENANEATLSKPALSFLFASYIYLQYGNNQWWSMKLKLWEWAVCSQEHWTFQVVVFFTHRLTNKFNIFTCSDQENKDDIWLAKLSELKPMWPWNRIVEMTWASFFCFVFF